MPSPLPGAGPPPDSTHSPGGELIHRLLHPSVRPVDHLYRKAPEGGWFAPSVSNVAPVQFEIGAFEVPGANHYWLFDYSFEMDRLSGFYAGASQPIDGESLTGILGFDVTANASERIGTLLFQLDPQAVTFGRTAFNTSTSNPQAVRGRTPQTTFNAAAYSSFALNASQGLSLLPPTRGRQGAPNGPWTWVLTPGQRLAFTCVIYEPLPIPVSAIGVRHQGYLLPSEMSNRIMEEMRPR